MSQRPGRVVGRFRVLEGGKPHLRTLPPPRPPKHQPQRRARALWTTYSLMTVWLGLYFAWPEAHVDPFTLLVDLAVLYALGSRVEPSAGGAATAILSLLGIAAAAPLKWLFAFAGPHFLVLGPLGAFAGGMLVELLRRSGPLRTDFAFRTLGPVLLLAVLTLRSREGLFAMLFVSALAGSLFWALVVGAPSGGGRGKRLPSWLSRF